MKKLIQRAQSKICFAECKNFGQNCLRRELRPNGKKMQWMVIAAIFSFCGCLTAAAQETEQFSIATLNVDGLPQKLLVWNLNAEGPGSAGSARIGKYLVRKGYDLVMMPASLKLTSCVYLYLKTGEEAGATASAVNERVEAPLYLLRSYEQQLATWFVLGGYDVQYETWGN